VTLAVFPSADLLASVPPLHVARAVHNVCCKLPVVFGLGGAPLVEAPPALDSVHEVAVLGVAVDPGFQAFAVLLVSLEVALVCVAVGVNEDAEPVFLAVDAFSLLHVSIGLCEAASAAEIVSTFNVVIV